jgi:hypothetical protein
MANTDHIHLLIKVGSIAQWFGQNQAAIAP